MCVCTCVCTYTREREIVSGRFEGSLEEVCVRVCVSVGVCRCVSPFVVYMASVLRRKQQCVRGRRMCVCVCVCERYTPTHTHRGT